MMSQAVGRGAVAPVFVSEDEKWAALVRRDPAADGLFCYGVRTTGIYCRPSCPARLARRENVRFHASPAEAEAAGLRACRRCRPNEISPARHQAARIAKACRLIEAAEEPLRLDVLAAAVGMSRFHFHRTFKAATGVTPRAYAAAHRAGRVRETLKTGATVTEAIYEAGFASSGRFYAASTQMLGMTPSDFRAGGADLVIRFAIAECSLGAVAVAATEKGVCAVLLGDDPDMLLCDLRDRFPRARLIAGGQDFAQVVAAVIALIETPERGLDLPLDIRGTAFQQRVWQVLREIPAGSTASYAEIAQRIGAPRAVRAVARACAANPAAVAIPCHRVLRSDGGLSGYRWGIARKRALLARERRG